MASPSDLSGYDDLTTAFIRHRERKSFDRNLDGKLALFVITNSNRVTFAPLALVCLLLQHVTATVPRIK